jgi:uncharacterized protein YdhG (YjbR/CyaY superfamily)
MVGTDKKNSTAKTFSDFERNAMKQRALELRAEERMSKDRAVGEKAIQDKIAEMPAADQSMAKKVHTIVTSNAPSLMPKTWYGMPAYANKAGKVVCFFQSGAKYESRYCTLGFTDSANLDEGNMWAAGFALVKLTAAEEKKIVELVKKAVS